LDELNVDGKLLTFILKKYGVRMTAYWRLETSDSIQAENV
jgi:hypothetical protein